MKTYWVYFKLPGDFDNCCVDVKNCSSSSEARSKFALALPGVTITAVNIKN